MVKSSRSWGQLWLVSITQINKTLPVSQFPFFETQRKVSVLFLLELLCRDDTGNVYEKLKWGVSRRFLLCWIKCILDCVDDLNKALGNVAVPMGAVSLCNQRINAYFVKCETCLLSNIDGICHHLRGFLTFTGAGNSFRCPKEHGVTSTLGYREMANRQDVLAPQNGTTAYIITACCSALRDKLETNVYTISFFLKKQQSKC